MPPPCGVESHGRCYPIPDRKLAANVNLHGASPWPPKSFNDPLLSDKHETPPGKPVVSLGVFTQSQRPGQRPGQRPRATPQVMRREILGSAVSAKYRVAVKNRQRFCMLEDYFAPSAQRNSQRRVPGPVAQAFIFSRPWRSTAEFSHGLFMPRGISVSS